MSSNAKIQDGGASSGGSGGEGASGSKTCASSSSGDASASGDQQESSLRLEQFAFSNALALSGTPTHYYSFTSTALLSFLCNYFLHIFNSIFM